MHYPALFLVSILVLIGCGNNLPKKPKQSLTSYIQNLEKENNISYDKVLNTNGQYITSMCYTKTQDTNSNAVSNPCYSCHTKGIEPNYYNDTNLQEEYNFPLEVRKNRFSNLFKDRTQKVNAIDDTLIFNYIRHSNYFDENHKIILAETLPNKWKGYVPDCYYNFDNEGFDQDDTGEYTLWRAFRYYPFLGTFWPTNGSTDDVLIRLDRAFAEDKNGDFDLDIYKLNLAIVESLIKQKDINLTAPVDEALYDVDLNQNGTLDTAKQVVISTYDKMSYVGNAREKLLKSEIHLAPGLFPEGTEFLHSVRYVDWDENKQQIKMSQRMKELRYAKKISWSTYSDIQRVANAELNEAQANGTDISNIAVFRGSYESGLKNEIGWIYQGFIEDKQGNLRPQTQEETIGCMGCHSHLGATTDSIFAYARKLEGTDVNATDFGWNHWTQKGLKGLKEPKATYKKYGEKYEYSFYLQNNHSGNEFRNNDEVQNKFFDANAVLKQDMLSALHNDISVLLFPSKERALMLDKGYKAMVEEQSYIYGRDANVAPMKNVYKNIKDGQTTGIREVIVH
jgi:hypothetical protein